MPQQETVIVRVVIPPVPREQRDSVEVQPHLGRWRTHSVPSPLRPVCYVVCQQRTVDQQQVEPLPGPAHRQPGAFRFTAILSQLPSLCESEPDAIIVEQPLPPSPQNCPLTNTPY